MFLLLSLLACFDDDAVAGAAPTANFVEGPCAVSGTDITADLPAAALVTSILACTEADLCSPNGVKASFVNADNDWSVYCEGTAGGSTILDMDSVAYVRVEWLEF